jgi:hypothetical protein
MVEARGKRIRIEKMATRESDENGMKGGGGGGKVQEREDKYNVL